jgi:gentisate 1,2-dioxygenase
MLALSDLERRALVIMAGRPEALAASIEKPVAQPTDDLTELYRAMATESVKPLWTEIDDLMPDQPCPAARPHAWRWSALTKLAAHAGELVPVGRGGERRAIALANPGLAGAPFATATLWAAIQYLGAHEQAPEHRHTQSAFRFVIEGEGVWTVVDGDPVAMRRGDLLLTPGWQFHGHHNASDNPMAWLDGLDIPLARFLGSTFFEPGPAEVRDTSTPARSRSEQLWAHPGVRALSRLDPSPSSPLSAYRWEHTDAALRDQLDLEDSGLPGVCGTGHAGIRFVNPTTGADVLPTLRAEFHRLRAGAHTPPTREVGSSVWQVFNGVGVVDIAAERWTLDRGDLFAVPPWAAMSLSATTELDLFRFSDGPVMERLNQYQSERLV